MTDCVVVAYGRSAIAKAGKGSLRSINPIDFGAEVLKGVLAKVSALDAAQIDDVVLGCAQPEANLGLNPARLIALRAGLPHEVSGHTVNRFCSSGLQAIAHGTAMIRAGMAQIIVAGGIEHMSSPVLSDVPEFHNPWLEQHTDAYISMGQTAENVARHYGISRPEMDELSVQSHARAAAAIQAGYFREHIVPVTGIDAAGVPFEFSIDEGVRPGTNIETLKGLKPAFGSDGLVTAATSSQRSDGAAFVVLMSAERAADLGLHPLARMLGFAVAGVDPALMGIGPIAAVPKVLQQVGVGLEELGVIELNEAFASQAIAVTRTLGLDEEKVNPNGGALALGHPLGATGAVLTAKLLSELARTDQRLGMVTMCVGGGMGAAAIFERLTEGMPGPH